MFLFWQLTDFHTHKYQPKRTPNYFINYVVLSQTPSGSQNTSTCLHSSPAWGWGKLTNCYPSRLVHPSLLLRESCLSSHQRVVPLCLPWIGIMGHPVYLPWSTKVLLKMPSSWEGVHLHGLFVPLSFCHSNRENHSSNTCKLFFIFNMKYYKQFCALGIWASARALDVEFVPENS